ncbi:gas vesicle protein GvpO, halophile-type [Haladaptatus sp. DJG-WS-42]|uniref:gas vesicle protein GvpO, halophile-type n=1 Tax=Haladaptatus sp. DJG-WS-42 TaxID=3120516 RepID=UPI0030D51842
MSADAQCHALTEDGARCDREATDGSFCYQHDEDDPTVDEETDDSPAAPSLDGDELSILDVRTRVAETATDLIGHELDGVSEVMATSDGGWRAVVEVVERHSVPDTQDILGQYELLLTERGEIEGYSRLGRFRRSDTAVQS